MYLTDETMDDMGATMDDARYAAQDGRDTLERYVSARDYAATDRDADEAHARGDHTDMGWEELYFPGVRAPMRIHVCYECAEVR